MVSGVPRLMPWLIPLVIAVVALHRVDVPAATAARYALYFAGCVVLPGLGVRWIYADGRDGRVSPDLDRLAVLRYEVSRVRIYQIPAR